MPFAPLAKDVERKLQKFVSMGKSMSMPVDRDDEDTGTALKHCASLPLVRSPLQLDKEKGNKPKRTSFDIPSSPPMNSENSKGPKARSLVKSPSSMMLLSYLNKSPLNQGSTKQKAYGPQPRPRSKSPLPSIAPSEVFREAKSSSQRFASPPPQRRGSEKSIYGKSFARQVSDMGQSPDWSSTPIVSGKHKSQKDNSWARKYSGGRRVSAVNPADDRRAQMVRMNQAVQTTVDWTLDPSKLLVGHRFASGAYSRLYRGFYDDKPVAIKFIRQPDDDDNGKMAAKLEKQYNSEINSLSHLYHKNVIKNLKPTIPPECPPALRPLIEQCCSLQPDKRPDFWQIVKVLEQFHSILSQGGCLDIPKSSTCQDPKKRLLHWIQKLKPAHST
nr:unnamed protein product [Digitaria exilis]